MPAPGIGNGLLRVGMVICLVYVLIAVGAGCNLAAIVANGGWMPADPDALAAIGGIAQGYTNSIELAAPALRPLTDLDEPLDGQREVEGQGESGSSDSAGASSCHAGDPASPG